MDRETIKKILEIAVYAPSGENSQPWRFKVKGNKIFILNDPDSDKSLYNYNQKGTFVAQGALIENIVMMAPDFNYKAQVELFPCEEDANIVAVVELLEYKQNDKSNLKDFIIKRTTNRKPYKSIKLNNNQLNELLSLSNNFSGIKLLFIDDKDKMRVLSNSASVNERVMLSNKQIHNFFFDHINWTSKEEESKKTGFYIKTLELPAPARIMMKIFKNWRIMSLFNKLGFEKVIAMGNAKNYANASAMGIIVLDNNTPESFVVTGRLLQKVWINATKMGLSIQPMTGTLFFMESILAGARNQFSEKQIGLIENSVKTIKDIFNINDDKTATMLFRIGYADAPSARSSKMPPNIIFEN